MSGHGHAHEHSHAHDHAHEHGHDHAPGHGHAHTDPATARVVLALGPESEQMPDLGIPAARPGRGLADAVTGTARSESGEAGLVVVVPMTFGRAPAMVADCSRTLRDVRARLAHGADGTDRTGAVALAAPFGDATMLVSRLRAALRRHEAACAALVVSRAIDPFADAELFRLARLARQYGRPSLVEVAFHGGDDPDPDLSEGLERVRALGGGAPVLLPATFDPAPVTGLDLPGEGAPLMGPAVLRSVIDTRVAEAVHRFDHGDDGIDAALDAEDGHGYAHSHVAADGTVYTHSH